MMTRDEKLKAIQDAHDEFVEGQTEEPEVDTSEFTDANQFGIDLETDQTAFVNKVEQATADPEPNADFKAAIDGLQAVLDLLKTKQ